MIRRASESLAQTRALLPRRSSALPRYRGMGATDQQITAIVAAAGSAIPVAGPFIAAAGQLAIALENLFSGCGATCTQTTAIVNQAQTQLGALFNQYMAAPVHYASMQTAFLSAFDQIWSWVTQSCGNPALGAAGQRCVTDRQAGACTIMVAPFGWSQNGGGWVYSPAGASGSGSTCWNWFSGMRDPVANDPTIVDDSQGSTSSLVTSGALSFPSTAGNAAATVTGLTSLSSSVPGWAWIGGGVVVAWLIAREI